MKGIIFEEHKEFINSKLSMEFLRKSLHEDSGLLRDLQIIEPTRVI